MKEVSDKLLLFLYITFIFTFLIGLILIVTNAPLFLSIVTGKATSVGLAGLCVSITPSIEGIGYQEGFVDILFYYDVNASAGGDTISFSDDTDLFDINVDNGEISFTPVSGDKGNHSITITVTNTLCSGGPIDEETFNLEIKSVAPTLDPIGNQTLTEDIAFYFDVNASDPDVGDNETLTFLDNTDLFTINSSTGIISFTPDNDNVGVHEVKITVVDTSGASDYEEVNFTVENINDAPVLDEIPNFTSANAISEDEEFYYDVNATDPDVGDVLRYIDDTALFVIGESFGVIQWTPSHSQISNYSITIYVDDGEALDSQVFNLEVFGVDDRPILQPIGAQTADINLSFYFDVEASDEEDGDESTGNLTFSDDTSLFNIDPNNGSISFTPSDADDGTYSINISVNDSTGQVSSELISFTVTLVNDAPTIDSYVPTDLTPSVDEGGQLKFNITMSDPEGTIPSVQWYLDTEAISGATTVEYNYEPNYASEGNRNITVIITDGELYDSVEWEVTVNNIVRIDAGPPAAGGGGGGGGKACSERWNCTDWSPCQYPGIQVRTCADIKNCGTERYKPGERKQCEFTVIPTCFDGILNQDEILVDCGGVCKSCPTCDDGIKNQGEVEIDCGGPCPGCPRTEKPSRFATILCGNGKIDRFSELFVCFKDSWYVWIFVVLVIFVLILKKKLKKTRKSVEISNLDRDRVERIKKLIKVADHALREKQISKLKVTCDRIEILYNGLKSERNKRKVYKKIQRLNKKINSFES